MTRARDADVPVVYGFPTGELLDAADRGEVELGGCMPPDPLRPGADVRAYFWTSVDGGRWSRRRRPHRIVTVEPLRGVEFWHEDSTGYTEGQVHELSTEDLEFLEPGER